MLGSWKFNCIQTFISLQYTERSHFKSRHFNEQSILNRIEAMCFSEFMQLEADKRVNFVNLDTIKDSESGLHTN